MAPVGAELDEPVAPEEVATLEEPMEPEEVQEETQDSVKVWVAWEGLVREYEYEETDAADPEEVAVELPDEV